MESSITTEIQKQLAENLPEVELLLAEVVSGKRLKVVIDHPEGVSLEVCQQVSRLLTDYRERYSLEVSSPGSKRPLTRPEHFRRFIGRRARLKVRQPLEGSRSVTGELVASTDNEITVAIDEALVTVPFSNIQRSHLVEG